ncbi:hypothetical protein [Polaromonas sp. JS666]|uniref:hypothetical protein n=1 Tax=Polaromonas sp. (strain JS666 / ATCC BAA-500) TaxID=296591 RepID=UPI000046496C|nr:hypothetical protein [Polaromonas sp. JS666]ABE43260.1 hypothetical protein Bpro_1310 [Polaromonas sp. JS666]
MNDYDDMLPASQGSGELVPYAPAGPLLPSAPAGSALDLLDDRAEHGHTAAPTVFGQQLSPGTSPQAVQQAMVQITETFARDMSRAIPAAHTRFAIDLFKQMAAMTPAPRNVVATHNYDLRNLAFLKEDHALVTFFANAMAQRGLPQSSAYAILHWYHALSARVYQQQSQQQQQRTTDTFSDSELAQIDERSESDREDGMDVLRVAWGHELEPRLALVRQYVRNLPAAARQKLENAVLPGGKLAANDAGVIQALHAEAVGPMPTGGNLALEIAEIEHALRTDRARYNRSPLMQARYLALLHLRDDS